MGEELPQRNKIIHHYSFLFAHIKSFQTETETFMAGHVLSKFQAQQKIHGSRDALTEPYRSSSTVVVLAKLSL